MLLPPPLVKTSNIAGKVTKPVVAAEKKEEPANKKKDDHQGGDDYDEDFE